MTDQDREPFARLMTDALGFYGQHVSPFAMGVWWQACQRFDLELVAKALTAHAMDPDRGQWAPKPADLVRQLHGTSTDRSLIAWGKVMDAMQRVGAYASVDFGDRATHCAIEDMGGWAKLCRSSLDELQFAQKRFCDTHRAYTTRGDALREVPHLIGAHEAENRVAGRRTAEPVRLGLVPAVARIAQQEAA